ncbi:MAG: hypothetical protein NVS4B9_39220 [Ktedonobacteraceae bacterium]
MKMDPRQFRDLRIRAVATIADKYEDTPLALHLRDDRYVDPDCYGLFVELESGNIYQMMLETAPGALARRMETLPGVTLVITDSYVENDPDRGTGENIPLNGILCAYCGNCLVGACEPDEDEPLEPIIDDEEGAKTMDEVRLADGTTVPALTVNLVYTHLVTLRQDSPILFYELNMKARDRNHRLFGTSQVDFVRLGLLAVDGTMHEDVRAVVLNCTDGEDFVLHSPVYRKE